jgi:TRAP-type mannitol/chloroaromatic compound transport system substrate-binding protein
MRGVKRKANEPTGRITMKRREFLKAAGVGMTASAVAAPAIAQSMPEVKWRLAASWPKSLDTLYGGCEYFAKRIAEITDNRFQIQVFAAGELVPGLQVLDAVQNGTIEMGNTALYYYWGKDPAFTFGTALPFGLNARQMNSWLRFGGGADLLNELLKNFNCTGVAAANTGAQMGGWFRKEIKSVDDLKGLKMRIGGFAGTIVAKLGLVPQQLAAGDIYPALEKGTLDACEWVGPYDDETRFLQGREVLLLSGLVGRLRPGTQHHKPRQVERTAKKLPVGDTASGDAWEWVLGRYDYNNPAALKRLLSQGVQLRAFPQDVMEACYKAALDIYADLSNTNPHFKKLYDSLVAFRGDSLVWLQVAELSFDGFMIRMRGRA